MTSRKLLLIAAISLAGWTQMGWADEARPPQSSEVPALFLAQEEETGQEFICCFGKEPGEDCDQNSPNQIGCEFALAYRCGAEAYTCDLETERCACPAAGETAQ